MNTVETPAAPVAPVAPEAKKPEAGGKYWRQQDFLKPERLNDYSFVVVGAGSVGSWTALALAKMGAQHITIWDRDVIDEHNVSCQVYATSEVGQRKAGSLAHWIAVLTEQKALALSQHLDKDSSPVFDKNTILIMAVDNMDARRYLWDLAKACPEIKLVLDMRMGGEVLRFYAVNPHDPEHEAFYEENSYSSADGEQLPCTAQAISYTSFFAAAFITSTISSYANGVPFRRELMFHTRDFKLVPNRLEDGI